MRSRIVVSVLSACVLVLWQDAALADGPPYDSGTCIEAAADGEFGGHASASCTSARLTGFMQGSSSADQADGPPVVVPAVTHAGATTYGFMTNVLPSAPGRYRVTAILEDVQWSASATTYGPTIQPPIASVNVQLDCSGSCVLDFGSEEQWFAPLTRCSGAAVSCAGSTARIELAVIVTVLPELRVLGPARAGVLFQTGAFLYGGGGTADAHGTLIVTDVTITAA